MTTTFDRAASEGKRLLKYYSSTGVDSHRAYILSLDYINLRMKGSQEKILMEVSQ